MDLGTHGTQRLSTFWTRANCFCNVLAIKYKWGYRCFFKSRWFFIKWSNQSKSTLLPRPLHPLKPHTSLYSLHPGPTPPPYVETPTSPKPPHTQMPIPLDPSVYLFGKISPRKVSIILACWGVGGWHFNQIFPVIGGQLKSSLYSEQLAILTGLDFLCNRWWSFL